MEKPLGFCQPTARIRLRLASLGGELRMQAATWRKISTPVVFASVSEPQAAVSQRTPSIHHCCTTPLSVCHLSRLQSRKGHGENHFFRKQGKNADAIGLEIRVYTITLQTQENTKGRFSTAVVCSFFVRPWAGCGVDSELGNKTCSSSPNHETQSEYPGRGPAPQSDSCICSPQSERPPPPTSNLMV